jgi:uncharacterized membrane protein
MSCVNNDMGRDVAELLQKIFFAIKIDSLFYIVTVIVYYRALLRYWLGNAFSCFFKDKNGLRRWCNI